MPSPVQEVPSLTGRMLAHYRVVEMIGEGGMGVVYRAHDEHLDCDVALKVLPPGKLSDEAARKRFRKEALALSKLTHPNIAVVHDFDTQDSTDFLVEELIPGLSLSERLISGPLSEREIVKLGSQLAEGLQAAHQQGVIHCDLKPANIRVTSDGRLKILDFGLARVVQPSSPTALTASETQRPSFSGTLPYMAPEQLLAEKIDPRTDIWAVGCVLYAMATSRPPFLGYGPALIDAILHQPTPDIRKLKPDISGALEAVIQKCLDKDPDKRYSSAREIAVDLHRLAATSPGFVPLQRRKISDWRLVLLFAVAIALLFWRRWPSHADLLTGRDTVVLADFTNSTGDAVFTDTLRQGLFVQLSQSPFLNIVSDSQVRATLRQMGHTSQERLSEQVAREVCQRNQSKVFIAGSIGSLGSHYVLGLKAVNCLTGDAVVEEQSQVSRKEDILESLSKQASFMRGKLGESLATLQKFDIPMEQATTPSLEALQAYSLALEQWNQRGLEAAVPFFKRATELDSNFALAYARLGAVYANLGQTELAAQNIKQAYALRENATDRERLYIESSYYRQVTGELEKAARAFEVYKSTYPQDGIPYANLGVINAWLGHYEKSLEEFRESLARVPDSQGTIVNLAGGYLELARLEEAKKTLAQAEARHLKGESLFLASYYLAFLRHDQIEMERVVRAASNDLSLERPLLAVQAETEAYRGRLKKAREYARKAVESARRNDLDETASGYLARAALREADFGNSIEASRAAKESLASVRTKDVMVVAALAEARAGNVRHAQALANELARRYPANTLLNLSELPTVRAAIEIRHNNPSRAIDILEITSSLELGDGVLALQPIFTRGQAYLLLHLGSEAAAEFQKILDHPGVAMNRPITPLAYLGAARALALQGDISKARAEYEQFLDAWKDADPDLPMLQQAHSEVAQLKRIPKARHTQ